MRLTIVTLASWLPIIAAINYGSLEGEDETPVKSSKPKSTKIKSYTKSSSVKSSSTSLTSTSVQGTSTLISTTPTITYAQDPLTTVTTTDEMGRTTVKPLWWIPSEVSTTTTETQSSHTALGKQVSLNTTESVMIQSNAGQNAIVNLGLAGSMAVILLNLI
ncbi:hypothetical protein HG537_0B05290 [Torulaspora globosa]|uniref:Uncharacterized protein n=1 Tax=Torulaspora globosa TaxID=48254 RepID=A0A7H9HS53_9SACH|nr:hypothetical protein HG537_0B05290 [Torulaspora sp. CBS 2947]